MEIEYLLKALFTLLPGEEMGPLRRILSIDGGIELLGGIVSSVADPSKLTVTEIHREAARIKLSSDYDWKD